MLTGFLLALQFLTRLPVPAVGDYSPEKLAASVSWFPLVGVTVGILVVLCMMAGAWVDPWLAAWLGVLAWVLVTGGLHLDGLADLADALGAAHRDHSRLLAVMKDPHLGSFGVLTLIVAVTGKLVLLMLLARSQAWAVLLLIPAWARYGVYHWQTLPPLSAGMAEVFAWRSPRFGTATGLFLLAASWQLSPFLLAMPIVILQYRRWLKHTLGGMSGDCLGAGIEVMELTGLALACLGLMM